MTKAKIKIKLIRKYENTRKKIINNECAILFNKTYINERLLPKYIYIYIYIYKIETRGRPAQIHPSFEMHNDNDNIYSKEIGDTEKYTKKFGP